jgi:hypothetical protein
LCAINGASICSTCGVVLRQSTGDGERDEEEDKSPNKTSSC